jgi:hypothetical protein
MVDQLDARRIRDGAFDGAPGTPAGLARALADAARAHTDGRERLEEALHDHVRTHLRSGDAHRIGIALTHLDVEARAGSPVALVLVQEAYASVDSEEWTAWAARDAVAAERLRIEVEVVADEAARRIASGTCGAG